MPRSSFQKLKIIYIMEYLLKNSDENHAVTTSQIIAYLKSHYITAERKTIYASNSQVSPFSRLGKKLCMAVEAFPSSST